MTQSFWSTQRVLVTGGHGFVGSHLLSQLKELKPRSVSAPKSSEVDFRDPAQCAQALKNIDLVIHLAANVGGIGYNQKFPGALFYDNLLMGVHLIEEARKASVKKFVSVGTICAYPKFSPIPFKEDNLWDGYPEETNAPYGLAKKMMLVQGQAYRQQYGFNSIYLLPVNMYGPADNFSPDSSHVVPALIKKFLDAKKSHDPEVVVWGTGKPTREFLYVKDAAQGILLAAEKFNGDQPVNLGSSSEISIKELAETIQIIVGYTGKIIWDETKPDGQPRRKLDVSRAQTEFGFSATTDFITGLHQTVEWYETKN